MKPLCAFCAILVDDMDTEGNRVFLEKTPSHVSIPPNQNGTMTKDAW